MPATYYNCMDARYDSARVKLMKRNPPPSAQARLKTVPVRFALLVAGLLSAAACPIPLPAQSALLFSCKEDSDCVAGWNCVRDICRNPFDLDAGVGSDVPGVDRVAADSRIEDVVHVDTPIDATAADVASVDAEVSDGAMPDVTSADSAIADATSADTTPRCNHDPPWWNEFYGCRVRLNVTEATAGTLPVGYSLRGMFNTIQGIDSGRILASGDDMRVVRQQGGGFSQLPRHILNLHSNRTQLWFKTVAEIEEQDRSYFVYYCNPNADAPPSRWSDSLGADALRSQVYLAADDFADEVVGSAAFGWTGSSAFSVYDDDDGNRVLRLLGDTTNDGYFLFGGDDGWGDVAVQVRMKVQHNQSDYAGLFGRASGSVDMATIWFGHNTANWLQAETCTVPSPQTTDIDCVYRGGWSPRSSWSEWHTLEVRRLGARMEFFQDSWPIGSAALTAGNGRVGLHGGYGTSEVLFDDVIVRLVVDPEPGVAPQATETCP